MFVNLPVKNLEKSMDFFKSLGYTFNPQFTDETAACMVIGEDNYAMLLTHDKMREFIPRPVADATQTTEVIVCLSCENKPDVDQIVRKALAAGGSRIGEPRDYGFMIQDSFQDLDGHIWEHIWMDSSAV